MPEVAPVTMQILPYIGDVDAAIAIRYTLFYVSRLWGSGLSPLEPRKAALPQPA